MSGWHHERVVPDPENPGGRLIAADEETLVREMVVILSAFNRFSARQIAAALHAAPESIEAIRADPSAQEAIEVIRAVMPRPGDLNELLMSDAERNIVWLRNLREGTVDGEKRGLDVVPVRERRRAAEVLLDRQVAKKVDLNVTPLRPIDITDAQYTRMRKLLDAPPSENDKPAEPEARRMALTDADFDGRTVEAP